MKQQGRVSGRLREALTQSMSRLPRRQLAHWCRHGPWHRVGTVSGAVGEHDYRRQTGALSANAPSIPGADSRWMFWPSRSASHNTADAAAFPVCGSTSLAGSMGPMMRWKTMCFPSGVHDGRVSRTQKL